MDYRINVSLDATARERLDQLKLAYEKKLGKLSLSTVIRIAILNALKSEAVE